MKSKDTNNKLVLIQQTIELPVEFSVTDQAKKLQAAMLAKGSKVSKVTSPSENNEARDVAVEIRNHVKAVKNVAKEIRDPINEAASRIIELEKKHCEPLMDEVARLERLGKIYIEAERRRVEEEERKRLEAIRKQQQEQEEAERKARAASERATTIRQAEKAKELLDKAEEEKDRLRAAICIPLPEVQRARGQVAKKVQRYKVLDPVQVFKHAPHLCKVEVKPSAVQSVVVAKEGATELKPDRETVPGLELWWDTQANYSTR